ncbi:MAG TPA: HU family DNA-binding protein [bacterium]|nr:HU family DNA-binding protein [bacterium]
MTKAELIDKIAGVDGIPTKKVAGEAVDALFATLTDCLKKGDSFTYQGFGTFKVAHTAARTGVNPATGQKIQIPAGKKAKFTPSKGLKDLLK